MIAMSEFIFSRLTAFVRLSVNRFNKNNRDKNCIKIKIDIYKVKPSKSKVWVLMKICGHFLTNIR